MVGVGQVRGHADHLAHAWAGRSTPGAQVSMQQRNTGFPPCQAPPARCPSPQLLQLLPQGSPMQQTAPQPPSLTSMSLAMASWCCPVAYSRLASPRLADTASGTSRRRVPLASAFCLQEGRREGGGVSVGWGGERGRRVRGSDAGIQQALPSPFQHRHTAYLQRCRARCFLRLVTGCSPICSARSSSQISATLRMTRHEAGREAGRQRGRRRRRQR